MGWWLGADEVRAQSGASNAAGAVEAGADLGESKDTKYESELKQIAQVLTELRQQAQGMGAEVPELDRLKDQIALQQKQIDVLRRMTELLADQIKKQPEAT